MIVINVFLNIDFIVVWLVCLKEIGGVVGDDDDDGNVDEVSYDVNVGVLIDDKFLVSC